MQTTVQEFPRPRPALPATRFNVASYLPAVADRMPEALAVIGPSPRHPSLTFAELEALTNRYANGLQSAGFDRGMRVLVMVRPGARFIGLVFALFKIGAVPVIIDPGMGVSRLLSCIRQVDLDGLIGVPLAHVVRVLRRDVFASVTRKLTVGRRWFWGGATIARMEQGLSSRFHPVDTASTDPAAILFTSGATGPAKGAWYEHGMFGAQVRMLQEAYGLEQGEADLTGFPLFCLFSVALGMTSVVPDMDPSHPAHVHPAKIVRAIQVHGVTNTFGSPAMWRRVAEHCHIHKVRLPTLRRVLMAGAPVPVRLVESVRAFLSDAADVHTPYGATEALPLTTVAGRDIVEHFASSSARGAGICVGKPLRDVTVRVIRLTDDPIETWSGDLVLPTGDVGEIVASGQVVTKSYCGLAAATAAAKIKDGQTIWHRMGDAGYFDPEGNLWYCGRKAHRVETASGTLFSVPCEAIFNRHPAVLRSALVGVGPQGAKEPVIIVEPITRRRLFPRRADDLIAELLALGRTNPMTASIHTILIRSSFPVDVRHNAKINRETLTDWADGKLR